MRTQIESRLAELKRELESGQARLSELESETAQVQQTLLRISGAIIALEELLKPAEENEGGQAAEEAEGEQPPEPASTAA